MDLAPSTSEQELFSFSITMRLNHHYKRYGPFIVVGRQDLMGDQGLPVLDTVQVCTKNDPERLGCLSLNIL